MYAPTLRTSAARRLCQNCVLPQRERYNFFGGLEKTHPAQTQTVLQNINVTWYTDLDYFFSNTFPLYIYTLRDVHPHLNSVSKIPSFLWKFKPKKVLRSQICGPNSYPNAEEWISIADVVGSCLTLKPWLTKIREVVSQVFFRIKLHVKGYLDLRILVPFHWTRGIGWLLPLEWSQCSWNWVPLLAQMGTVCVICFRPFLLG